MTALSDIKVLELGQLIAGPYCGQILGDFGADVVKIEPPKQGDAMRQWGSADSEGRPVWWSVIARNKRSIAVDLRTSEGQALIRDLAAEADILIENFRPGTMERWGLGYDRLSERNEGLIMVRVSGYGQTGPYATRAGFASVCEAMGGMRAIAGYPDRPSVRTGLSIGDTLAGIHGAMGALMALHARKRIGKGQVVDASILESVLAVTESLVPSFQQTGAIRERSGGSLPGIAPSNAYPSADGHEVVIGANQDSVFRRLATSMGQPELADDSRFCSHRARGENSVVLDEIISDWTVQYPADDLVEFLAEAGVPAGMSYRAPEILKDRHIQARGAIAWLKDEERGDIAMQNVFPQLSVTPGAVRRTGPQLGADTEDILRRWLSLSGASLSRLRESGVV